MERRKSKAVTEVRRNGATKGQSVRQGGAKDKPRDTRKADEEKPGLHAKGEQSHRMILAEE